MILYKATIPLAPISKKNSQRILLNSKTGRHFIAPSAQYERYERDAMRALPTIHPMEEDIREAFGKPRRSFAISRPVNVKALFFMPTHRRVDLVNLLEALDDVLVKRGVLIDDNSTIIVSHDGSRVLYDKANPRTEIVIEEV